jgi:23S rRNA pseudouridine1911/1915/1917 synthase
MGSLDILYEDNHLLVVNKPAGIATMGASEGPTVHSMAADYIKRAYNKPGKAFVGVVSRLDSRTSGVIVLARTSKAAARLSQQFAVRSAMAAEKIYLAALDGTPREAEGELVDFVMKDDAAHRMRVVDRAVPQAREARLRYCRLIDGEPSIVAVRLLSGRKHQIRLQFAQRGHPVTGDRKYGSRMDFPVGIALHSWRLRIVHPTQRTPMWFQADPPPSWKHLTRRLCLDQQMRRTIDLCLEVNADDES